MKFINNPQKKEWNSILQRPTKTVDDIEKTVNQIFEDVQSNGDVAIEKYTSIFDGVSIEKNIVSVQEIKEAISLVSLELKEAINFAKENITKFHTAQKTDKVFVETTKGVACWQEKRSIQKVGLYIPGGTAPLFSTVLMLAIPAQIAGCKEIVLCSPPNKEGKIHPAILYAANASFVASDLLSQAEHGTDSQVILVSTSKKLIKKVEKELKTQLQVLPRVNIAGKAIDNSKSIFVETDKIALDLINEYGPEHFIVCTNNNDFYIDNIENAGSVFIGNYTPESAGDYASGTNHTLPTNGFTKAYSGVNLDSFLKSITFQKITKEGILNIGNSIELMAAAEGLQAHKNAVTLRIKELK